MKIFVVGASGRVGNLLTAILAENGHEVYAGARRPENISASGELIHKVTLDLHANVAEIGQVINGMDAVYFVAGSRGHDLLQTDAFGAVRVAQATQANGIDRFILLSSLFATEPSHWDLPGLADLTDYNIAKYFADTWVMDNFKTNYTILQPATLTEDAGTGKITINVTDCGKNPIEDVAETLATMLDKPVTYRKIVTMHSGNTPIAAAF